MHALGHDAGVGDGPPRASVEATPPSREDGESLTGGSHGQLRRCGHGRPQPRQVAEYVVKGNKEISSEFRTYSTRLQKLEPAVGDFRC